MPHTHTENIYFIFYALNNSLPQAFRVHAAPLVEADVSSSPAPLWLTPPVFPQWAGPGLVGFRTQWLHQWGRQRLGWSRQRRKKRETACRYPAASTHTFTRVPPPPSHTHTHTHSLHSARSDAGECATGLISHISAREGENDIVIVIFWGRCEQVARTAQVFVPAEEIISAFLIGAGGLWVGVRSPNHPHPSP